MSTTSQGKMNIINLIYTFSLYPLFVIETERKNKTDRTTQAQCPIYSAQHKFCCADVPLITTAT